MTSASQTQSLLRDLAPQVLAVLMRKYGDFSSAEDAVQEAMIAAAKQWPVAGLPASPRGWLYQVAVRRLHDHARTEIARRRREEIVATESALQKPFASSPESEMASAEDDTLLLLFMCCHSALSPSSAVALTLRAVGGLSTAEIANAFMVPEATMAQRISRAKQTIRLSKVPFDVPSKVERADRLTAVLHVLYLIFNEGYTTSAGPTLQRLDLSNEAIRLTRGVQQLLPDIGEVSGLLALMLLTDARRDARSGPNGELIPLDEQDRTLWNQELIAEGVSIVSRAMRQGNVGSYLLQAAIAAVHDEALHAQDTDWKQIVALYSVLKELGENPMVTISHAVATAMVDGPAAGLLLLSILDEDVRMRDHYRLSAVRAHLYEKSAEHDRAFEQYQAAAQHTTNIPERNYLITKATRLSAGRRGSE